MHEKSVLKWDLSVWTVFLVKICMFAAARMSVQSTS